MEGPTDIKLGSANESCCPFVNYKQTTLMASTGVSKNWREKTFGSRTITPSKQIHILHYFGEEGSILVPSLNYRLLYVKQIKQRIKFYVIMGRGHKR